MGRTIPFFDRLKGLLGSYGQSPDGNRDYNAIYGYPATLTYDLNRMMYDRSGLAQRLIRSPANSCWREKPKIMVDDTEILEDEMEILVNIGLLKALERADTLNRLGEYGVLVVRVPDNEDLGKEQGTSSAENLNRVKFSPFPGTNAAINKWSVKSDKFGEPENYQVQNRDASTLFTGKPVSVTAVNASRVVHLAEGALESEWTGLAALDGLYNAVLNVDKVLGASAEAFFQNVQKLLVLSDKAGFDDDLTDVEKTTLKEQMDDFINNFRKFIKVTGMDVTPIQPAIASPKDTYEVSMNYIAGASGFPLRMLTGEGAGQLSGSEDRASWNTTINQRQNDLCTNWLLETLRILSNAKMLNLPDNAVVEWPSQSASSDLEQSEINRNKAQALQLSIQSFMSPGVVLDAESVFEEVGLSDIEIEKIEPIEEMTDFDGGFEDGDSQDN